MYDYAEDEHEGSGLVERDGSDPCNKYPSWQLLEAVGPSLYHNGDSVGKIYSNIDGRSYKDSDDDGIPDYVDNDDDNDGIFDDQDNDDNNDGIPDIIDNAEPVDSDVNVGQRDIDLVRTLLRCPASETFVNYADENGETPLLRAAVLGDGQIVSELLKHPAIDVNQGCNSIHFLPQNQAQNLAF